MKGTDGPGDIDFASGRNILDFDLESINCLGL